jgi:hypothetical protein
MSRPLAVAGCGDILLPVNPCDARAKIRKISEMGMRCIAVKYLNHNSRMVDLSRLDRPTFSSISGSEHQSEIELNLTNKQS